MTAYFGAALVHAINAKDIDVNFKGVALGDGWVDPVGCMYSYGPYLRSFSQVTEEQSKDIERYASFAQNALEEGNGTLATSWWGVQQNVIGVDAGGINWYNSLYYYDYTADNQLDVFLATNFTSKIASILPSGVSYNAQSGKVFNKMAGSFMSDGIRQVAEILNAGYEVNVYTGQVDLIVDVLCMENWVSKLNWDGLSAFFKSPRIPVMIAGEANVGGFVQGYKNFRIWNVNLAGHMVPLDNPPVAAKMMATIVGASEEKIRSIRRGDALPANPTINVRNPLKRSMPR
jgi:serine carboxypeptidase 1